ncbi:hypothetical protein ACFWY6_03830 [Streptomyces sp. NPDC059037]|uniref:hypothetical protein n=1 Tax=Streptomyces sp. NPDC059037 TaxID=3346710 RepID=UPI00367BD966
MNEAREVVDALPRGAHVIPTAPPVSDVPELSGWAAQERVLTVAQREKAAHIAFEDLSPDGMTVRNYGLTPVTRVLVKAEAFLEEEIGPDEGWATIDRVRARGEPHHVDLLPAGDSARFSFVWEEKEIDPDHRRGKPDVAFEYTDAAGTRWQRAGFNLPVYAGESTSPARRRNGGASGGARSANG